MPLKFKGLNEFGFTIKYMNRWSQEIFLTLLQELYKNYFNPFPPGIVNVSVASP